MHISALISLFGQRTSIIMLKEWRKSMGIGEKIVYLQTKTGSYGRDKKQEIARRYSVF